MEKDIKQLKDQEKQEVLEEEVKEVKTGRIEVKPVVLEEGKKDQISEKKEEVISKGAKKPVFKRERKRSSGGRSVGEQEFEQKIIDLARVTRVMAGGKRLRFRACVAIGDRKGRVAIGLAKGQDVTLAISKAVAKAKKNIIKISFINETIPFEVKEKFKAAKVLLKPTKKGRGIIAGGAVRVVLELAGVPNVVAKILGTNNQMTNVKATIKALKKFENFSPLEKSEEEKAEDKKIEAKEE